MPRGHEWITTIIPIIILGVILWINIVKPRLWLWRMRRPYSVHFREHMKTGGSRSELRVAPGSTTTIHLNQRIQVPHHEVMVYFGFDGDEHNKPEILHYENEFIKRGKMKISNPETSDYDHIDVKGRYILRSEAKRDKGDVRILGFSIRTKDSGTFPINFMTKTDAGDARPTNKLTLIVENQGALQANPRNDT